MSCETIYWKKPGVLLENKNLNFIGTSCTANRFNAFFRFVVIVFVIGVILDIAYSDFSFAGLMENTIGVAVIGLIMMGIYYFIGPTNIRLEGFEAPVSSDIGAVALTGPRNSDREDTVLVSSPGTVTTYPSPANPFMNVLVHEVKYNPSRGPAADVDCPMVKGTLENYYRVQWWADPTDVFGKSQGQRQFYTMPSTSIPSDRQSFQDWLYLIPGKTCKEGGRDACVPGTNGGAIPWLSQPN